MFYEIRRARIPQSIREDVPEPATTTVVDTMKLPLVPAIRQASSVSETMKLPVLPRPEPSPEPSPKPVSKKKRSYMGPIITTTATSVICLGMAVGLPMVSSIYRVDRMTMPPDPPGNTQTDEPGPSLLPTIPPSPPQNPVEQPPTKKTPSVLPTPIYGPSVCETQVGTVEGQLPDGEPVLPAISDRPSIFVVSPDRSAQQSFTVRLASDPSASWNTVYQASNVGIVGITIADTQFQTTNGQKVVWAKSCEPQGDAVNDVSSRVDDLCRRTDLGLKAVVVYSVGVDGKPVEMSSTDC